MRAMWLEHKETKQIWDCLPSNPYSIVGGCFFANPQGLGYEQEITQKQINVDYFINEIKSTNQEVTVQAYFNSNEHLNSFVSFVGDFTKQMNLYYSPDGSVQPYDQISNPYYKPVTISRFVRGEMNSAGFIVCTIVFKSQSDVWRKDYLITTNYEVPTTTPTANVLEYPYQYPYTYGGDLVVALDIDNNGRETGCIVEIKNTDTSVKQNIAWVLTNITTDRYGNQIEKIQKATFNVNLAQNDKLYVDSNSTTQEAKVIFANNTEENVANLQEPSWAYINFVRLQHGSNRFVFYIRDISAEITVKYSELKEVI